MSNVKVKAPKKPVKPVIVVIYILLVILAVIYLAPLLWMLSVSLKDNAGVMSAPFSLPEVFHFENYAQAWQMGKLGTALINSVIVCGATLIVSLFFGAMAAFAIARMRWKLSEFMHTFFLIGMMVPVHCVLIPLFVRFAKLGLTNSQGGLMIPYITFSLPMTIFLLTGFFRSMPGEMFEAAAIDGCGIYGCFFRIALPLCRTGFFVSGLMTFINNWNELLLAMVFISDPMKKTLPVMAKSSLIGAFIGAIPGTGGAIASFIAYNEAKRKAKPGEKFGEGEIKGIAAPESANNGATAATLIPLLTLGIPGDVVAATLLGAFTMQGLVVGPKLFETSGPVVYAILIGCVISQLIMFFQGKYLLGLFSKSHISHRNY